jgi:hypothetical protein
MQRSKINTAFQSIPNPPTYQLRTAKPQHSLIQTSLTRRRKFNFAQPNVNKEDKLNLEERRDSFEISTNYVTDQQAQLLSWWLAHAAVYSGKLTATREQRLWPATMYEHRNIRITACGLHV